MRHSNTLPIDSETIWLQTQLDKCNSVQSCRNFIFRFELIQSKKNLIWLQSREIDLKVSCEQGDITGFVNDCFYLTICNSDLVLI